MAKIIALVEDEIGIAQNTRDFLHRAGYHVKHYVSRKEAEQAFAVQLPDLAIIDVGLGEEFEGGFELCRWLRAKAALLPIIFFTARDSAIDEISGLRLGADDYLTKDISQQQLLARIVALFRRIEALQTNLASSDAVIHQGELQLNTNTMIATWQGQTVDLTVTEIWMVQALAKHPGHVKNRQQLMEAANVFLDDNSINTHIKRIRKKFAAIDAGFAAIKTAYGMGYRWQAED